METGKLIGRFPKQNYLSTTLHYIFHFRHASLTSHIITLAWTVIFPMLDLIQEMGIMMNHNGPLIINFLLITCPDMA